jgi:hypothetical protein
VPDLEEKNPLEEVSNQLREEQIPDADFDPYLQAELRHWG